MKDKFVIGDYYKERQKTKLKNSILLISSIISVGIILLLSSCNQDPVWAKELTASWYDVQALKDEGTWNRTHGVMANGELFNENSLVCANRLYSIGTMLRVTNIKSGKSVVVKTTDRVSKRFGKTRIDLSRFDFQQICPLEKGLCKVKVEVI